MADETLQAAFEIKTVCDEISRRLLRWHWEQTPGKHSLDALLDHIRRRQTESPTYYERMPDLDGKASWSQLDTTLCMRVLLDPEKDAARPLDLLGQMQKPGAARRACNAVRTARNEAAHAADSTDAVKAAILFNEAVESLEEAYEGTALRTTDLEGYYREAEDFLKRCGASEQADDQKPTDTATKKPRTQSKKSTPGSVKKSTSSAFKSTRAKGGTSSRKGSTGKRRSQKGRARREPGVNYAAIAVLAVLFALGLLARAYTMGLIG